MKIDGYNSIDQVRGNFLKNQAVTFQSEKNLSFLQALNNAIDNEDRVKFSKHASERLENRNITLTDNQLERLYEGTRIASNKGIKESLVLLDNLAFIVNTKNNTVITAMSSNNSEENVYTNIDGAVVI